MVLTNAQRLIFFSRQGGSSSLSDHSDRSSASVQTVYKIETPPKDLSPEAPLEFETQGNLEFETQGNLEFETQGNLESDVLKQEKLSLTSSSSDDSSDENFGEKCCGNITGHSAETYHRYFVFNFFSGWSFLLGDEKQTLKQAPS